MPALPDQLLVDAVIALSLIALLLAAPASGSVPPRPARASLDAYFTAADYPAEAFRAGLEGTVGVRLGIGPDGRVHDCAVTANSGAASLDAVTCRILRERATFAPARNRAGGAVDSAFEGVVAWRLPEGQGGTRRPVTESLADSLSADIREGLSFGPRNPAIGPFPARRLGALDTYFRAGDYPAEALAERREGNVRWRVIVGTNGRVSSCAVTRSSGDAGLDAATCRILRERARYVPARDRDGEIIDGMETGTQAWRLPPASQ